MFRFLHKSMYSSSKTLELCKSYSASSTKSERSVSIQTGTEDPVAVRYLMNECGFSMEKAVITSSKYFNFENPDKPDSVFSFFKEHGFSDSQIRKLVAIEPRILSSDPQKTLLPKFQFFRSKGFSEKDIAKIMVFKPKILKSSLENKILPSFTFITDFFGSEKDAILAISGCARILLQVERHVKPNIEILLGAGMSRYAIGRLLKNRPSTFTSGQDRLKESIKQVQNMNMDPESCSYGLALWILTVIHRSSWDKRMEAFKRWGCSEDDVLTSFKILPFIMTVSVDKLDGIMSLFVHEIGWEASEVVKRYFMFTLSLKKRLIPRWSVYQELLSKGLIKKANMSTMFQMKEDRFLKMFVDCNKIEAPLLLNLYREKQK